MIELSDVPIATLDDEETKRFASIVRELPESVLSKDSVEKERARVRDQVDELESELDSDRSRGNRTSAATCSAAECCASSRTTRFWDKCFETSTET